MGPSIWQLLIVLVIVILLFGTKRLKNIGSDIGGALRGFKKAVNEGENENPAEQLEKKPDSKVIDGEVVKDQEKNK